MEERTTGDKGPDSDELSGEGYEVVLPETDEVNEDLIGLSEEEYARRRREKERLIKECENMLLEGEKALKKGDFSAAETYFRQGAAYCPDDKRPKEGILRAVTKNFSYLEPLKEAEYSHLSTVSEEVRAFVLKEAGENLKAERASLQEKAAPLQKKFLKDQSTRRESFGANRKYYLVRFSVNAALFVLFLAGCIISCYFIPRTKESLPAILAICLGAAAGLLLIVLLFSTRRLLVSMRLYRENERMSSTKEGAELETYLTAIKNIDNILDGDNNREE